jgi:hypothetical protein
MKALLLSLLTAGAVAVSAGPANAQPWRRPFHRGYYGYYRPWRYERPYWGYYRPYYSGYYSYPYYSYYGYPTYYGYPGYSVGYAGPYASLYLGL